MRGFGLSVRVVMLAVAALASFVFAGALIEPASAAGTSLAITPASKSVNPGEPFTLEVTLTSDVPVMAGQFSLSFDATRLEVLSIEEGDFLKNHAESHGWQTYVPMEPEINNSTGKVSSWGVAVMGAGSTGTTGSGPLAVIKLRAKNGASGEAELNLSQVVISGSPTSVDTSVGAAVPAIDDAMATGARVSIGGPGSSAPPPSGSVGSAGGDDSEAATASTPSGSGAMAASSATAAPASRLAAGGSTGAAQPVAPSSAKAEVRGTKLDVSSGMKIPWEIVISGVGALVVAALVIRAIQARNARFGR